MNFKKFKMNKTPFFKGGKERNYTGNNKNALLFFASLLKLSILKVSNIISNDLFSFLLIEWDSL